MNAVTAWCQPLYVPRMADRGDAPGIEAGLDDAVRVIDALKSWYEGCYVSRDPTFAEAFARSAARRRLDEQAEGELGW